jgi:SAM-dependent methyltransferase
LHVPTDNAAAWDRHAASYQAVARLPTDVAHYGPEIGTEADFRLLGEVKGRRILELGCGGAQCSIAFAKQGATAIGIDSSAEMLAVARRLCEQEEVKVELRQSDMADLAFLRAESVDAAFSAYAFGYVEDLDRVFRQVNRVLKPGAPLVFSLAHPASIMVGDAAEHPLVVRRSYFDRTPVRYERNGITFTEHQHTVSDLFGGLTRAGYRVDTILEPEPLPTGAGGEPTSEAFRAVPRTLIMRARKEGG